MPYRVLLKKSAEGWAAWVPLLPRCASQGATEEEALANVTDATTEYLAVAGASAVLEQLLNEIVVTTDF